MTDSHKIYEFAIANGFDPSAIPDSDAYNWCITALTPATEHAGPVTGVPDLDTQNTFQFNWRQTNTITPPSGITADWDCEVLTIPGPGVFALYRTKPSSSTTWTSFVIMNDQYSWNSTQPVVTNGISGGNAGNWYQDTSAYRAMYHSATIICNAPSLADQGMVVSGQIAPIYTPVALTDVNGTTVTGTNPVAVDATGIPSLWNQGLTYNQRAPSFDTVLQTCPRGEMRRARDGAYIPHRFYDGLFRWQPSNNTYYTGVDAWGGISSNNWHLLAGWKPSPLFGRMNYGVAAFRGLGYQTTLQLFTRSGYELVCSAASSFRPFLNPSCGPDMTAVEKYFRLAAMLSESYPASYNEKDTLTAIIGELANSLLPPKASKLVNLGTRMLGTKAGKKGVKSVAKLFGAGKSGTDSEAVRRNRGTPTVSDNLSPRQRRNATDGPSRPTLRKK